MCKKTPLYDFHLKLKGKMVPFAGYWLPVQYESGIIAEHLAVRNACGLFDVSHMGEILLQGKDALSNLQNLLVNDMSGMAIGRARYSPMCNMEGGVVDDLLVCKLGEEEYMLVVNASNKDKDVAWVKQHLFGDVTMQDVSDEYALFALQGPHSRDVLSELMENADIPEKNYTFTQNVMVGGFTCMVSRTGYTGELGYEIFCKPEDAVAIGEKLLQVGEKHGLIPCGLGARDTLRLEAGMPLYGHEMNDEITPLEAGLGFFVKMEKPGFIGKDALLAKGAPQRGRVGLEVVGRGIVREDVPLYVGDEQVGVTTSGTMSPYLHSAIAMALLDNAYSQVGTQMEAEVRGRRVPVQVIPLPFYKRNK